MSKGKYLTSRDLPMSEIFGRYYLGERTKGLEREYGLEVSTIRKACKQAMADILKDNPDIREAIEDRAKEYFQ